MSLKHIIESWRDAEYRESLDDEARSLLPESPAGEIELSEAKLAGIDGGADITWSMSVSCSLTLGCGGMTMTMTATVTVKSPVEGE